MPVRPCLRRLVHTQLPAISRSQNTRRPPSRSAGQRDPALCDCRPLGRLLARRPPPAPPAAPPSPRPPAHALEAGSVPTHRRRYCDAYRAAKGGDPNQAATHKPADAHPRTLCASAAAAAPRLRSTWRGDADAAPTPSDGAAGGDAGGWIRMPGGPATGTSARPPAPRRSRRGLCPPPTWRRCAPPRIAPSWQSADPPPYLPQAAFWATLGRERGARRIDGVYDRLP